MTDSHTVHQGFIEPRAGLVEIDSQGRIEIWQCHQSPFGIRRWLAEHADIPEEMIVVHPVSTGGSFGGKQGAEDIIVTYYLARAARRAVKFVESYQEELQDGQPRHAAVVMLRTGVKKVNSPPGKAQGRGFNTKLQTAKAQLDRGKPL